MDPALPAVDIYHPNFRNLYRVTLGLDVVRKYIITLLRTKGPEFQEEVLDAALTRGRVQTLPACSACTARKASRPRCYACGLVAGALSDRHRVFPGQKSNLSWANCKPALWYGSSQGSSEMFKLYAGELHRKAKSSLNDLDAAAVLNILIHCGHFSQELQRLAKAAKDRRHEVAHHNSLFVEDTAMQKTFKALVELVHALPLSPPVVEDAVDRLRHIQTSQPTTMTPSKSELRELLTERDDDAGKDLMRMWETSRKEMLWVVAWAVLAVCVVVPVLVAALNHFLPPPPGPSPPPTPTKALNVPFIVPPLPKPFYGYQAELQAIEEAVLAASPSEVVTVTGPGGAGVSSFLIHAATNLHSRMVFNGGVYYVRWEAGTDEDVLFNLLRDLRAQVPLYGKRADVLRNWVSHVSEPAVVLLDSDAELPDLANTAVDTLVKTDNIKVVLGGHSLAAGATVHLNGLSEQDVQRLVEDVEPLMAPLSSQVAAYSRLPQLVLSVLQLEPEQAERVLNEGNLSLVQVLWEGVKNNDAAAFMRFWAVAPARFDFPAAVSMGGGTAEETKAGIEFMVSKRLLSVEGDGWWHVSRRVASVVLGERVPTAGLRVGIDHSSLEPFVAYYAGLVFKSGMLCNAHKKENAMALVDASFKNIQAVIRLVDSPHLPPHIVEALRPLAEAPDACGRLSTQPKAKDSIVEALENIGAAVKNAAKKAGQKLKDHGKKLEEEAKKGLESLKKEAKKAGEKLEDHGKRVEKEVKKGLEKLEEYGKELGEGIKDGAKKAEDKLKNVFKKFKF